MPAYSKYTVTELRQMCETRGIEHDGLTKTRLIGETESVTSLRLKLVMREKDLARKKAELRLKEIELEKLEAEHEARRKDWEREREGVSTQTGSQSSRGTNAQLPSEIFKMLPRMSSNLSLIHI